jgi:RNA polymerase sigma-32 factor
MINFSLNPINGDLNPLLRGRNEVLTPSKERELTQKYYKTKQPTIKETLVLSNLGLVAKTALTYAPSGISIEDLFQEGVIGLMKAIEKFNPDLGYRLGTYASFWILASVQSFVINNWSLVKVGTTTLERQAFFGLGDISKAKTYEEKIARIDDYVEKKRKTSKKKTRLTRNDVEVALNRINMRDFSLHQSVTNDEPTDSSQWIDCLMDDEPVCEEIYEREDVEYRVKIYIGESLRCLNPREKHVIKCRHLNEDKITLQKIAEELGVTRERIRQIEQRALKKIEKYLLTKETLIKNLIAA